MGSIDTPKAGSRRRPGPSLTTLRPASRRPWSWRVGALLAAIGLLLTGAAARAEGQLRIARQFGLVYLLLDVVQDQKLVEKHGTALGIAVKPEFIILSGGSNSNDALLSGSIDVAAAGVGPLLTIWDRTHGRQNVRGIASLGNFSYDLISINPKAKSLADLTDRDRIALPAVGVSVQARLLQLASAKVWGDAQYARLDKNQVAMPHPDAAAAIIKAGTEVTAHFSSPPFQQQELAANPAAHVLLRSYDILGGPSSATVLYGTEKFRRDNPKTYQAFIEALADAARFIQTRPEQAADIFLRTNKSGMDRKLLLDIIRSPDVGFTLKPQHTQALAEFMNRVGAIKNRPASAKDYFFDDAHNAGGN